MGHELEPEDELPQDFVGEDPSDCTSTNMAAFQIEQTQLDSIEMDVTPMSEHEVERLDQLSTPLNEPTTIHDE